MFLGYFPMVTEGDRVAHTGKYVAIKYNTSRTDSGKSISLTSCFWIFTKPSYGSLTKDWGLIPGLVSE